MNRISFPQLACLLLGLFLTTASFGKDGNTPKPGTGRSTSPAFVGTRWQMSTFKLEPAIDFDHDGQLDTNLLTFMSGCDRDNSLVFEPGGKIALSEEVARCGNGLSSNGKPTSWRYDKAARTIKLINGDKTGSASNWEVLEASAKTLVIKTTITQGGKTTNAILSWKAL